MAVSKNRCEAWEFAGGGRQQPVRGRVVREVAPRAPHGDPTGIDRLKIWLNQAENSKPSNGLEPLTPSLPWASTGATGVSRSDKSAISRQSREPLEARTQGFSELVPPMCPHG
jgi:hypothetical protein